MEALKKAADYFGSQAALAGALGVGPMAISSWKKRGRVPTHRAVEIERMTGGAVTKEELRPDVFGAAA